MSANTERLLAYLTETLTMSATQNIDFWVSTIHVDGVGFRELAYALFAGGITVDIDAAFLAQNRAEALYDSNKDRYVFSDATWGSSWTEKGAIVHESVHAMTDLRNMIWVTHAEEEVAAYVAEMLFFRYYLGVSVTETLRRKGVAWTNSIADQIAERADKIGDKIANQKGASVSLRDILELSSLLPSSPTYQGIQMWGLAGIDGLKWS